MIFKRKKLRVAMVAPVFGDTGGPEVMVQNLTDALLKKGMDVTLFAPADWKTRAKHICTLRESLRRRNDFSKLTKVMKRSLVSASQIKVLNYQKNFDVIHLHLQSHAFAINANVNKPCVLSFHSSLAKPEFNMLREANITTVALSRTQKGDNKTSAVIGNGVPISKINPSFRKGKYLIAVGRLCSQKGIDIAIKIARGANKRLLIFGRIEESPRGRDYYNKKIVPHIDGERIVLMKETPNKKIFSYLGNAEALLFPIRKPEVFGMVVAESLACGTPVIGTRIAPLPETLRSKKVAYLANNIRSLIEAARNTDLFDRKKCREYAEKHFDSEVMAEKYINLYKKALRAK